MNEQWATNDKDIAKLFAKKFDSVCRNLDLSNTSTLFEYHDCNNQITLTVDDIEKCIEGLDPENSSG